MGQAQGRQQWSLNDRGWQETSLHLAGFWDYSQRKVLQVSDSLADPGRAPETELLVYTHAQQGDDRPNCLSAQMPSPSTWSTESCYVQCSAMPLSTGQYGVE